MPLSLPLSVSVSVAVLVIKINCKTICMLRSRALNENHFPCCRLAHFDFYFDFFFWQHFPPTTTHTTLACPDWCCVCVCVYYVSYLFLICLSFATCCHCHLHSTCACLRHVSRFWLKVLKVFYTRIAYIIASLTFAKIWLIKCSNRHR